MANITRNILTINGSEEQVSEVRNYIKGSNGEAISLESIYPMPKELTGEQLVTVEFMSEKISVPDWMAWRGDWWGVIRDVDTISEGDDDPSRIVFNSDSGSPFKALIILSKMFPEVTFHTVFASDPYFLNAGEYTLKGGEPIDGCFYDCMDEDNSSVSVDEAMEYFFITRPVEREFWKKNSDGEWYDIEAEEEEEDEE